MVDFIEGYIILAYRHTIVTFNVIDKNIDDVEKSDIIQEITIDENKIDYLSLEKTKFKIICF